MALHVAPETETKIRELVKSGRFESTDAVIAEGLRLLDVQKVNLEKLERLRVLIDEGDEGEGIPLTRESWYAGFEQVKESLRSARARGADIERADVPT